VQVHAAWRSYTSGSYTKRLTCWDCATIGRSVLWKPPTCSAMKS
jgi:hypothetical protein